MPFSGTWWDIVVIVLAMAICASFTGFMRKAGADSYDSAKRALGNFRNRKKIESTEGDALENLEPDWSRKRVIAQWAKWVVAFFLFIVVVQIPGLLFRPVLWNTFEILIYGYIGFLNFSHWVTIDTFEKFFPNGRETIWGKNSERKRIAKKYMTYGAIALTLVMMLNSMNERNVYAKIAKEYCLTDLPGNLDRWIEGVESNLPVSDAKEQQLRESIRSPLANMYMADGACKE